MKRIVSFILSGLLLCGAVFTMAGCGEGTPSDTVANVVSDTASAEVTEPAAPKFDQSHASVNGAALLMTKDELRAKLGEPDGTEPQFPDIWVYRTGDTVDMEWDMDGDDRVEVRLYTDRFRLDNGACVGMSQEELCALFDDNGKGDGFYDELSGEKIGISLYGSCTKEDFQGLQKGDVHQYAFIDVTQHAEPVSYAAIADYYCYEITERSSNNLRGNIYNAKFYIDENAEVKYISLSVALDPYIFFFEG